MKTVYLKIIAVLLFLASCDNLKRQSEFTSVCNNHVKFLQIEKYIYPIGAHNVYLIDSLNNKFFCFDYDETANGLNQYCNQDTIFFIKSVHKRINNDSILRYYETERVFYLINSRKFYRDSLFLDFYDDTIIKSKGE